MKLLTHNMLMSPGTRAGYPLAIVDVEKMEVSECEFNGAFIARMVEKIDYSVVLRTMASVRAARTRPATLRLDATAVPPPIPCPEPPVPLS